jgi:hypothetical protein
MTLREPQAPHASHSAGAALQRVHALATRLGENRARRSSKRTAGTRHALSGGASKPSIANHRKEDRMASSGGQKLTTLVQVAPGATVSKVWNNAKADVYHLHAWPEVAPGVTGVAEITKVTYLVHGNPSERELHFSVKNTGTTTINIGVWAFYWYV